MEPKSYNYGQDEQLAVYQRVVRALTNSYTGSL
jgi:hypothetical protein